MHTERTTQSGIVVHETATKDSYKNNTVIRYTAENKLADDYLGSVINAATSVFNRGNSGSFGISPDGKRNYNLLFGYGENLTYRDYKGMYLRGGIANTVVAKVAKTCWRDMPELKSGDNAILADQLLILKRHKFFRAMERADIANRIGKFSVLYVGIPDGLNPMLPVGVAKKDNFKGMYFNVYEEDGIIVNKWDTDPASPRYNKPELYSLQVTVTGQSLLQSNASSIIVHHSRIVHLAEGALSNSLEGCSSLEAPWNAITDKLKVSGSNAEANFKNSRQKIVLAAREGAKSNTNPDAITALKENAENFQNNQEDFLRLNNMDATAIQPNISSPRDSYDINVEEVAGTTGIPVRILTTKAGGTVTGSEDKATWNALVNDRQEQECTPWLLDALSIMSEAGILELPDNAEVVWPAQSSLSEKEASESMEKKAGAFEKVMNGLGTVGGDEMLAETVLKEVGFDKIKIDDIDLSKDDEKLNKSLEA